MCYGDTESFSAMAVDFLPLCDLLFNFISVATYFCDVAFDVIVAYSLYADQREFLWFSVLFAAMAVSLLLCQVSRFCECEISNNLQNSKDDLLNLIQN